MQSQVAPRYLVVGLGIFILMLVLGLMVPIGSSQAQLRSTPEGGFGGNLPDIQQTREAASQNRQATVDAVQQNAANTREAMSGNAQATRDAISGNAQATRTAISGNANATRDAIAANAAATRTAIAGNADARATSIVSTGQARATNAVSTVQARSVDAQATGQARATDAVSTAQARATTITDDMQVRATNAAATVQSFVDQGQANLQATVTAVVDEWEDYVDSLPDEAIALIDYYIENSSIEYNPDSNTLDVTTYVSEATANEIIDPLVAAAGYDPDSVTLDTVPGQIHMILTQDSTELTLIYELVAIDGTVEAVLVGALLNGSPLPLEAVPEQVTTISQTGVFATYADLNNLPYADYSVYVNTIDITDAGALFDFAVTLGR